MSVTKHLTELCALLVDDNYGELPSRIFANLLSRGRSTIQQLAQHTSLTPRQVRNGIIVLSQHNLLYFQNDKSTNAAAYEANVFAAYDLLRAAKVLDLVQELHGPAARHVVQKLQACGQTRVVDLQASYERRDQNGEEAEGPPASDGEAPAPGGKPGEIRSVEHLDRVLSRLLGEDVVEMVTPRSFLTRADSTREVEDEVTRTSFSGGIKGAKQKEEWQKMVNTRLRERRDLPKKLKRPMGLNGHGRSKIRKLLNGDVSNGFRDGEDHVYLDPDAVLRVNYERCLVLLRNRELVRVVSDTIGETTGQVYDVVLRLVTESTPRCRPDPMLDSDPDVEGSIFQSPPAVTTTAVFIHLGDSVDVFVGIGKTSYDNIDPASAERLQKQPPEEEQKARPGDQDVADGDASADEDMWHSDDESLGWDPEHSQVMEGVRRSAREANGAREAKVTFEDAVPSREDRMFQMRQHLLLLCENRHGFVRHSGNGLWTVDFDPLLCRLREMELDNIIQKKVGRRGLRLVRILREKGKLDERTLPNFALMKRAEVQNKMPELQMHGFADLQEVPRDNSRAANRTMFYWYYDEDRSVRQQLDNTYKAMLRCLQVREVHREANKEILAVVERPDVKGREKDVLEKKYFDKYDKFRHVQERLLGQVLQLDCLVGILKDY